MKSHLQVFVLSAILIASIGLAPAFGQSSIVVTTDKTFYSEGDTILVTGEVSQILGGFSLSLIMKAPNGNLVGIAQETVGADKKFSMEHTTGGNLMKEQGTYTIEVQYGDNKNNSAITSFDFGGVAVVPDDKEKVTSTVTETTVSVGKGNDRIGYEITGGKILSITPEPGENTGSLIILIESTEDGSLTLTIPRSVFDAEDEEIFVLLDGEEVNFDETTSEIDRTLTIEFYAGSEEIEIIGTFVIPEFGTIAAMILVVAIISIIAISSKSRLSIIPRY